MRVLAIDTALGACQVAVAEDGRPLALRCEPMDKGHQERLAPLAAEALAEAGLRAADLDRIGVTIGPGSFTGLRVGLAFAKGLSLGLGAPCVGVGVLEALGAGRTGAVAAVIDARRERVYLQLFRDGAVVSGPELIELADARRRVAGFVKRDGATLTGPGAPLLADGLIARTEPVAAPDILQVARLTASAPPPTCRPTPLYLREPDARTIAERALAGQVR